MAKKPNGANDKFAGTSKVSVQEYAYRVEWGSSFHYVSKNKVCNCKLGKDCPSVERVKEYWETGGQRAPEYPDDYWETIPKECPICGEKCESEPRLDFHSHGRGWRCTQGTSHYWEARLDVILRYNSLPRYVVPPTDETEGILVSDARTFRESKVVESNVRWKAEGYEPWN